MKKKQVIIVGAGPAGLTAAHELLKHSRLQPVIFEKSSEIGGLSRTVDFNGNRMDIGGHRFFSKSEKVMDWWLNIMPLEDTSDWLCGNQEKGRDFDSDKTGQHSSRQDLVMLCRERFSRILFLRSLFDYPISLRWSTVKNLGLIRLLKIGWSCIVINIAPIRNEDNLEKYLINRFGKELYLMFFKDYTEKVWGVPCNQIPADWGAQRIKGLSLKKTLNHAIRQIFFTQKSLQQTKTETSLIGQFLYPRQGPGQLWSEVARKVVEEGAEIHLNQEVVGVEIGNAKICSLIVRNNGNGAVTSVLCDYLISSMSVQDLIAAIPQQQVPDNVRTVAEGLVYRDFVIVGLLLNKLQIENESGNDPGNTIIPDHWIYIQESDVRLGRVQIFNNWSPGLVKDSSKVWVGLEYFCSQSDALWNKSDCDFIEFAVDEFVKIGFGKKEDVLESTILRVPKTYPAYFGTYPRFDEVRNFTDTIDNLFLVGRNGMHRYNNADHSMLTAMMAVESIINGSMSKDKIWQVNSEAEYHEER